MIKKLIVLLQTIDALLSDPGFKPGAATGGTAIVIIVVAAKLLGWL